MKLEVGMYVRTKWGINKINEYVPQSGQLYLKNDVCVKSNVIKASHNIIDLIEVGDYVNGFPVAYITDLGDEFGKRLSFGNENYVLSSKFNLDKIYIYEEDIKSIVTKEQFEAMKYEIK